MLERVVLEQLLTYCDEHGLIPKQQHGFRPNHSTLTAIASATHDWGLALAPLADGGRNASCVAVAAFDVSAAFDTVSMTTVLRALKSLGCSDSTAAWFQSYMSGGRQAVIWNGATSSMSNVTHGVRQGSILGPMIFLIVTRAFPAAVGEASAIYADDVNAWEEGEMHSAATSLSGKCNALATQTSSLELALNAAKTQLLLCGPGARPLPDNLSVSMEDAQLKPRKTLELLGLHLDDRLSPKPALQRMKGSIARLVGTAIRTRPLLLPCVYLPMMQAIVNGSVSSYATALVPLRLPDDPAPPTNSLSHQVQVLINDVARAMLGVRRADKLTVASVLDRAGITSLNRACFRSAALLAWGAKNCQSHPLHQLFNSLVPDSRTRAAAAGMVNPVAPRVAVVAIVTSNMAKAWNFSGDLRAAKSKFAARSVIRKLLRAVPV